MKHETPHIKKNTLRKAEKLCSQKIISGLFQPGFFISKYPFRVNVLRTTLPVNVPAQVLFVVSRKKFSKAVDRNRIKRVMRELYRLQKKLLFESLIQSKTQVAVAFIYTGNTLPDYKTLEPLFRKVIQKLIHEITTGK